MSRLDKNRARRVVFNISLSFQVENVLGEGAYGIVCSARHLATGIEVAIKKIEPFDKPLFCLRTLREITLLHKFNGHENIVQLLDIQKPMSFDHFSEVYLIQEYMECDLTKVIREQKLSDEYCQYFTYQILRGLKMVHSASVIHRDLKPSNILINGHCDLKICDFGLARLDTPRDSMTSPQISQLTEYVATRWYRAPEVMLTASQYTTSIDMWLVGCILAEMLTYQPLFPGSDYRDQLYRVFRVLGTPSPADLECIPLVRARQYIEALGKSPPVDLHRYVEDHPQRFKRFKAEALVNPLAIDLLKKLLVFDPANRITVEEAIAHPYLSNYHDINDEPTTTPMLPDEFYYDVHKSQLDANRLKREMFNKVMSLEL